MNSKKLRLGIDSLVERYKDRHRWVSDLSNLSPDYHKNLITGYTEASQEISTLITKLNGKVKHKHHYITSTEEFQGFDDWDRVYLRKRLTIFCEYCGDIKFNQTL